MKGLEWSERASCSCVVSAEVWIPRANRGYEAFNKFSSVSGTGRKWSFKHTIRRTILGRIRANADMEHVN